MSPEISIIVPVYNVQKYINECIDSILKQTFKDYELILINDGSTDKSGDICDEYAKKDDRVRVIHKENGGLSSARNRGLDICVGKYIGFVDSDDLIDLQMYEILHNLATTYNADIVSASVKYFKELCELKPKESIKRKINIYENNIIEAHYNDELNEVAVWNKIYKYDVFKDIRFPEGRIYEDASTTYKLYLKSNRVVDIKEELYFYRVRSGSITRSKFSESRFDIVPMYEEQYEALNKEYPGIGEIIKYNFYINLKNMFIDIINEKIGMKKLYLNKTSRLMKKEIRYIIKNKIITNKDKVLSIMIAYIPILINYIYSIRKICFKKGKSNA